MVVTRRHQAEDAAAALAASKAAEAKEGGAASKAKTENAKKNARSKPRGAASKAVSARWHHVILLCVRARGQSNVIGRTIRVAGQAVGRQAAKARSRQGRRPGGTAVKKL